MRIRNSILLGLLAITPPASAQKKERARQAYEHGAELMAQGKYREAIEAFEDSYIAMPHPNTLYNLAQCHEEIGDRENAIDYYQRVVKDVENEVLLAKARDALRRLGTSSGDQQESPPVAEPESKPEPTSPKSAQPAEKRPLSAPMAAERPPERRAMPPLHMPKPMAWPGLRVGLWPGFFVPTGNLADLAGTGFKISSHLGYEWLWGSFGLTMQFGSDLIKMGAGDDVSDNVDVSPTWIAAYGGPRAALHLGRVVPWFSTHFGFYHYEVGDFEANGAQVSCKRAVQGAAENANVALNDEEAEEFCSDSTFGINFGSGVDVLILRRLAVGIGFHYDVAFFGDLAHLDRGNLAGFSLQFGVTYYGP